MASTISRPDSAPCCFTKQELDKQVLSEKIQYPLSRHDVPQSPNPKSFSSSSCNSLKQNQTELNSKAHARPTYNLRNGLSQPRYVVSPTYQNDLIHANMLHHGLLSRNEWTGGQDYANLYLTRSISHQNAQLPHSEENSKPLLPPKKQTSYGKVSRNANASNSTSTGHNDINLSFFKGDNTVLQVPRRLVTGHSSRNRAPLKVEEANELSSSFKSEEEDMETRVTRDSLQIMNRSSRCVNESGGQVFHRIENDGCSDIRSLYRVLKYLMVLLVGFIVGAGVHALVKCWSKDSVKK